MRQSHVLLIFAILGAGMFVSQPVLAAEAGIPLEPGRIVGGMPAGLFYYVNAFSKGASMVKTITWLFLPGNRVSRVHPYGGMLDPSRCSGDTCGSYKIENSRLSVRWDGGRVDQWDFAASAEGVRLDGRLFRPARVMTAKSLVGRWSESSQGGFGSNVYTFDGENKFTFGTSSRALSGTYDVQGFALTLSFADGDVRRRALFAASAAQPDGLISVDSEVYALRQEPESNRPR